MKELFFGGGGGGIGQFSKILDLTCKHSVLILHHVVIFPFTTLNINLQVKQNEMK